MAMFWILVIKVCIILCMMVFLGLLSLPHFYSCEVCRIILMYHFCNMSVLGGPAKSCDRKLRGVDYRLLSAG
ncbi:hypothetical protein DFH09DRAFT_300472 [Mycena vulgaris]|nr:hypothetical protein DFH09DRAFT_300472 [Mycena vulgaris]